MKKSVKILTILFFITSIISVCSGIGAILSIILYVYETVGLFAVKVCLATNVIAFGLVVLQAYHLLNIPTIK